MYDRINTKENYTKLLNSGMFFEVHPELTGNWEVDKLVILGEKSKSSIGKAVVIRASNEVSVESKDLDVSGLLNLAGELAAMARLVTTANTKNLSQRIMEMEAALNAYDNEILSLIL